MRDHTKLRAFELADEVVLLTYRATIEFPKSDQGVKSPISFFLIAYSELGDNP